MSINHILFIRQSEKKENKHKFFSKPESSNDSNTKKTKSQSLFLFSYDFNIFDFLPRLFTITTNTGSSSFNTYFLQDTSSVIADFLKENPNNLQYHLDINDEENTLGKFEQLYQGEFVAFDEDQLLVSQKITKLLNITRCPNFMKPESLKEACISDSSYNLNTSKIDLGVQMSQSKLIKYLQTGAPKTFTIKTNKKEYKCNVFGVYASNVIRHLLEEDPTIDNYVYNYDDEFNEFQSICKLFNFEEVDLTKNNMDSIKEIAEDLQITLILKDVDNFINTSEKVSQKIDEQQTIIDSIDELFELLYSIKEDSVVKVSNTIIESKWSQTEDKVKELIAFILQVIKADFLLHQPIFELLMQLDQGADDSNKLNILMPFFVKQIMKKIDMHVQLSDTKSDFNLSPNSRFKSSFSLDNQDLKKHNKVTYYAFVYKLYQKGIIKKDELYEKFRSLLSNDIYLKMWFLPEIMEINPNFASSVNLKEMKDDKFFNVTSKEKDQVDTFINSYLPDRIEEYKKMRDRGEPEDELTRALRNDDVDTVQRIVTKSDIDFTKCYVPYNIFENYLDNGNTRYINYAAAYGSIRCFKYLLMNHDFIDDKTFAHAVIGGNIEIIKIASQNDNRFESRIQLSSFSSFHSFNSKIDQIIPSIAKHRNELFDWIFEQKFTDKDPDHSLSTLIDCSVSNGNAHSLIEIIDKGFNLSDKNHLIKKSIQKSAKKGYCLLTNLLLNLTNHKFKFSSFCGNNESYISVIYFENISILNLFFNSMNQNDFENCLNLAIEGKCTDITKYLFETLVDDKFKLTSNLAFSALQKSLNYKSTDTFQYIIDQINLINPKIFINYDKFPTFLMDVCNSKNIEFVRIITELIIDNNITTDFTNAFQKAIKNNEMKICEYLIEKNVPINFDKLSDDISSLATISANIFSSIITRLSPEGKEKMSGLLEQAIEKKNESLVKFLLKENIVSDNALFLAVSDNNLNIVNIILDHNSKPSFVNQVSKNGTALYFAVSRSNLDIVKRLLSVPGIDPNLYECAGKTPLVEAIVNFDIDISNAILNFYQKDDHNIKWQIERALCLIDFNSKKNAKKDDIIELIYQFDFIDPNMLLADSTYLIYACSKNKIDLVEKLIKSDIINVNMYEMKKGDTPLIISIKNNYLEIVKLLINHPKININQKNYSNYSPLVVAVMEKNEKIIDLLLESEKFDPDESSLNYAFYKSKGDISKKLINLKSLDVNCKFDDIIELKSLPDNIVNNHGPKKSFTFKPVVKPKMSSKTCILMNAVENNDIDKVDLIIHHPSFDKNKSKFQASIIKSIEKDEIDIFRKLLKIVDDDVNLVDHEGNSLLYFSIYYSKTDIFKEILSNPNFDSKKSGILKAFRSCYLLPKMKPEINLHKKKDSQKTSFSPLEIMTDLYNYDQKHDHLIDFNQLLENGHSFFTDVNPSADLKNGYEFFLNHGADPNIPDKFGVYPLQHAINIESTCLIITLISSNKVDFNIKIPTNNEGEEEAKQTTYLHLAAEKDSTILWMLLNNGFDINVTNDLGETPLFIACKKHRFDSIDFLFTQPKLDYLHRDNLGRDAIKAICPLYEKDTKILNRNQYHNLLIELILNNGIPIEESNMDNTNDEQNDEQRDNKQLPPLLHVDSNKNKESSTPSLDTYLKSTHKSSTSTSLGNNWLFGLSKTSKENNPLNVTTTTTTSGNNSLFNFTKADKEGNQFNTKMTTTTAGKSALFSITAPNKDNNQLNTTTTTSSKPSNAPLFNFPKPNKDNNQSDTTKTTGIAPPFSFNQSNKDNNQSDTTATAGNAPLFNFSIPNKDNNQSNTTKATGIAPPFSFNQSNTTATAGNAPLFNFSIPNKDNNQSNTTKTTGIAPPFSFNQSNKDNNQSDTTATAGNAPLFHFSIPNKDNNQLNSTKNTSNNTLFNFSKPNEKNESSAIKKSGTDDLNTETANSKPAENFKMASASENNQDDAKVQDETASSLNLQPKSSNETAKKVSVRKFEFHNESFSENPQPNPVQQHPNPVQQNQNLVQQHPNPVQHNQNLVQQHPNPVQQNQNLVQQHPNPVQHNQNLVQQQPNPVQQHPNLVQQQYLEEEAKKERKHRLKTRRRRHDSSQDIEREIETAVSNICEEANPEKVRYLSESISRIASRKADELARVCLDDDYIGASSYQPPFSAFFANEMQIQQQQEQWLHMIQTNNAHLLFQTQMAQKMKRKEKKKRSHK